MIIAVDFDNVICQRLGKELGPPVTNALDGLDDLKQAGFKIIIYTVMASQANSYQLVKSWLIDNDVEYDEITAIKPQADVYLDDKAIRFIDWEKALNDIEEVLEIEL